MQGLNAGCGVLDHPGSNGNGGKSFKLGITSLTSFRMDSLKNEGRVRGGRAQPEGGGCNRAGCTGTGLGSWVLHLLSGGSGASYLTSLYLSSPT